METIKELEAVNQTEWVEAKIDALNDVVKLIDELFPCEQLRKLKARIEG